MARDTQKNDFSNNEGKRPTRRSRPVRAGRDARNTKLLVMTIVLLVALIGLAVRLIYIDRVHGAEYQKMVLTNQQYDTTIIPFRRGDIYDAKGSVLASSERVYNIIIDPSVILSYDDDRYLEPTLRELGNCFPELDMDSVRTYIAMNPNSKYYVPSEGKRLPFSRISPFQEIQKNNDFVRGVYFEEEFRRIYPNGSLASTVLGYTKAAGSSGGEYGLEGFYENMLVGTDGRVYGYQNEDASLERSVREAVDGYNLHTTIDANVQSVVEKYLKDFNDSYKDNAHPGNGAENIGCIIMEVNTGNILAMAQYPDFDPSDYKNTDPLLGTKLIEEVTNPKGYFEYKKTDTIITPEVLEGLSSRQTEINLASLWKNFCIANTYEPGSVSKPFTVAAALEDGSITGNEVYTCNGSLEVGDHTIKCHTYLSGGDGAVSVQNAIAWSCNVALMKIGQTMGRDEFCKFQQMFNFGLKTNVDLAGEARTASLVYTASTMNPTDLATNTFGQNFNCTMIQMITGFCSLINGGYYYEPHVVDKITNSAGAVIENIEPRLLKQTISESTSEKIRTYCRATVMPEGGDRRTGKTARPAGYAIGGKTGTAQTLPRGNGEYVVSFMGYAPADDPQIAIYVVVDRPNVSKQDDAKYATVIVRNILTEVLPYLNIYMTEELSDAELRELEEKNLKNTLRFSDGQQKEEEVAQTPETITEGDIIDSTGEQAPIYPIWMTYPIDEATGYRVSPEGIYFDALTGDPISGDNGPLDDTIPTNDNLTEGQTSEENDSKQ